MNYGRIVFATLSLSACVQQNRFGYMVNYSLPVLTTFKKHSIDVSISRKEWLSIGVDSVKKLVICRNGDNRVHVEVTVPARVSASHIEMLAAATKTVAFDRALTCTASIEKSVLAYEIRYGDSMYVTPAGGETSFYGYRADRRPDFRERVRRTLVEGSEAIKDVASDLYEAADDELSLRILKWNEGRKITDETLARGARAFGEAVAKQGVFPQGPM